MSKQQSAPSSSEIIRRRFSLRGLLCLIAIFAVFLAWLLIYNRPPPHMAIEQAYFHCDKCDSLQGGVFGKGPTMRLHTMNRLWCIHNWRRIDRARFKTLATENHGIDWSQQISFWTR